MATFYAGTCDQQYGAADPQVLTVTSSTRRYLFWYDKAYMTTATLEEAHKAPWPESASEQYRPSDRPLSAKLVPTFAARGSYVVNTMDPRGRILGFLDRSRYFSFQVAAQLYSRG
jgi:hypothetical protein